MIPVILSGGSGSRLWPLSRKMYPKQFLSLAGEGSLFQQTLQRLEFEGIGKPIVVCNQEHRFLVNEQLAAIGCKLYQGYLFSPARPLSELPALLRPRAPKATGN